MSFTVSALGSSVNVGTQVGQERDRILYDGLFTPGPYAISVTAREGDPTSDDEFEDGSGSLSIGDRSFEGETSVTVNMKPGDKDDNDTDDPNADPDPDEQASYTVSLVAEVIPAVLIQEADVTQNNIIIEAKPPGRPGVLKVRLKGLQGASEQIYNDNYSGELITIPFGLERFTNAQAEKTLPMWKPSGRFSVTR